MNLITPANFLVADTRLYTLPCRSVGPSDRPSVRPSVRHIFEFRAVFALLLLPNRPRLDCRVSGLVENDIECMVSWLRHSEVWPHLTLQVAAPWSGASLHWQRSSKKDIGFDARFSKSRIYWFDHLKGWFWHRITEYDEGLQNEDQVDEMQES